MPRRTVMTPTFVAEACALMKREGVSVHMAARKMGCSPSTIMRCTGGKRAAQMGKRSTYLDKLVTPAKRASRKVTKRNARNTAARKSRAAERGAPKGLTKRKLTPKSA